MEQFFYIFSNNIGLKIDQIPRFAFAEDGYLGSMRNDGNRKGCLVCFGYGQADAVDGNRTLFHDIAQDGRGSCNGILDCVVILLNVCNGPRAVHMTGYDVSAKSSVCRHCTFQIDGTAWF